MDALTSTGPSTASTGSSIQNWLPLTLELPGRAAGRLTTLEWPADAAALEPKWIRFGPSASSRYRF